MKIELKNFDFSIDNTKILKNINISINDNVSLIGTSASGKTTLLKVLEEKFNIIRVFECDFFTHSSLENELKIPLLDKEKRELVNEILGDLNFQINPNNLSKKNRIKLSFTKAILNSNFISLDNILCYFKNGEKKEFLKILNKNKIKFINVTTNLEDLLETKYTYILNNGEIIAEGPSNMILLQEKLLKRLGFELPFMVDLSLQLKYYGLLNEIILEKEVMVNKLWK